jgi:hypothetical protein
MDWSVSDCTNVVSKRRSFEAAFGDIDNYTAQHSPNMAMVAKKFRASTCCPTYHDYNTQQTAPEPTQPQVSDDGVFNLYQDPKWHVALRYGGQSHYLGAYERKEDACRAYGATLRVNWHLLTEQEMAYQYQRTVLNHHNARDSLSGEISLQLA